MIDETIHFQYPASQIFPVLQNPFLQLIHANLHDQTIFPHCTMRSFPYFGSLKWRTAQRTRSAAEW